MIQSAIERVSISEQERLHDQHQSTIINQMLQKLSTMDLPERERVQCYMRHKRRLNHKPNSLRSSLKAIELFLTFYTRLGRARSRMWSITERSCRTSPFSF